jgi:hypothetical protein
MCFLCITTDQTSEHASCLGYRLKGIVLIFGFLQKRKCNMNKLWDWEMKKRYNEMKISL